MFVWLSVMIFIGGAAVGRILCSTFLQKSNMLFSELMNGAGYVLVFSVLGFHLESVIYCLMGSVLFVISIIDVHFYVIPSKFTSFLFMLGIFHLCVEWERFFELVAGFFSVSIFLCVLFVCSQGNIIGGGDIKLMAVCGFLLGDQGVILAFCLACVLTIVGYGISCLCGNRERVIAMGPYLSAGVMISLLWGEEIWQWIWLSL